LSEGAFAFQLTVNEPVITDTVTEKVDATTAGGDSLSLTLQVSEVVPMGNKAPLAGLHVTVAYGAIPPETVGGKNVTATGLPSSDVAV
jgi:hypothetical protein